MTLYVEASIVGRKLLTNFEYDPERPARHCRICGVSYQPLLARSDSYPTDPEVQWAVEILLQEWAINHNRKHSTKEHEQFRASGHFLTPEAVEKLVPLGVLPIEDIVFSGDHAHAARQAKRAPDNDVPDR